MSDAAIFLLRFLVFAGVHSLLALPSFKKRFGARSVHLRRFYRLYYNIVSLLLFGWVMAAYSNSTVLYFVPGAWSLVLYSVQLTFLVILVACVRQTGAADFLVGISEKSQTSLVTNGCYGVVRHPLYLFSMLFLLSNPVVSARSLLMTLAAFLYFYVGARLEESRLTQEFGHKYLVYQRTVPFIIPRIFNR